jgi:hypothetical protein
MMASNGRATLLRDKGEPADCSGGVRHGGGVNVFRLLSGTGEINLTYD